jgi:hypothetical protein
MRARRGADDGPVTLGTRSHSMLALVRRLALGTATLGALALSPAVAPAGAKIVETEAGAVKVGAQPRSTLLFPGYTAVAGKPLYAEDPAYPEKFANPTGAPVLPSSRVYAIYWDPTDNYHGDWQNAIDGFLQNMGTGSGTFASVFTVDSQYTDAANQHASYRSTFMGAVTDTEKYPPATCTNPQPLLGTSFPGHEPNQIACLTDKQIRAQLETFIGQHSLPKGMGTIFYVLTPPGVTVCLNEKGGATGRCSEYAGKPGEESYENSFCSYHSDINPDQAPTGDPNTILYAVIPWSAGGVGDTHLGFAETELPSAYPCQDGGFNPFSKPAIEQREEPKKLTEKEAEELKNAKPEERELKEKEREREGPHPEEPNQGPNEVGPDGTYDHGLSDPIINQIAIEQQNTVTDPLLDGWQDTAGNEATDECRDWFATANTGGGSVTANELTDAGTLFNQKLGATDYYLNDAFNLAALKLPYPGVPCLPGIRLIPQFTAPNPVNAEELVGFNGMESDIALDAGTAYNAKGEPAPTYATYTWNFGDGTPTVSGYAPGQAPGDPPATLCEEPWLPPCAGSTFHSYKYGGVYEVTLTVTDVGGNTATSVQKITVVGPPAPGTAGSGSGTGGSAGTGVAPGTVTPGGPGKAGSNSLPGPVATAAAVSSSLKQVSRSGLVVRYAVNEQVAGRFEVLLNAATAHRLGIVGRVASGLPAGTPESLVIGQALLVTTKGGKSSVRIKFNKSTAKRLRRAHKVTLTLRLTAHNASKQNPLFTTVMSTVVLGK